MKTLLNEKTKKPLKDSALLGGLKCQFPFPDGKKLTAKECRELGIHLDQALEDWFTERNRHKIQ